MGGILYPWAKNCVAEKRNFARSNNYWQPTAINRGTLAHPSSFAAVKPSSSA